MGETALSRPQMTPTRRSVIAGTATAVVVGLAGCTGGENDVETTVTDGQQADDIEQLSVETTNGKIQVRGAERETVSLTGRKQAPNEDRLDAVTVETAQTGQTLEVTVTDDDSDALLSTLGPTPKVDLDLEVPASLTDVDASTTNGEIQLTDLGSDVTAETTNGDITAELSEPTDVSAKTTNGDVELTVPSTTEADLSLDTTNGSVHIDGLGGYETASQSSAEVTLGAGTRRIECETTNGDVTVRGHS